MTVINKMSPVFFVPPPGRRTWHHVDLPHFTCSVSGARGCGGGSAVLGSDGGVCGAHGVPGPELCRHTCPEGGFCLVAGSQPRLSLRGARPEVAGGGMGGLTPAPAPRSAPRSAELMCLCFPGWEPPSLLWAGPGLPLSEEVRSLRNMGRGLPGAHPVLDCAPSHPGAHTPRGPCLSGLCSCPWFLQVESGESRLMCRPKAADYWAFHVLAQDPRTVRGGDAGRSCRAMVLRKHSQGSLQGA